MPNESALLPTFGISQNPDGTVSANVTVPVAPIKSINWAALLQAVIAALPSILAIIAAFTGNPTPSRLRHRLLRQPQQRQPQRTERRISVADTDPRLFPAVPNAGGSFSSDDKSWIMKEVESGLRNHRPRLAAAIENQAFYDLESDRYQPRREAETEFDFAGRPKRQSRLRSTSSGSTM